MKTAAIGKMFMFVAITVLVLGSEVCCFAFSKKIVREPVQKITEFEIALGETVNGYTYTTDGVLLYDGKNFSPAVTVRKTEVPKFKISILNSKKLAAAIGLDVDGKNMLFLLDVDKGAAREINEGGAASSIYWSPSGKYLVVLCSYEGERFISIDLITRKILDKGFISAPGRKNLWRINDAPKWVGKTDVLEFSVNEICNYYENTKCPEGNEILAVHKININASNLKVTKSKVSKK